MDDIPDVALHDQAMRIRGFSSVDDLRAFERIKLRDATDSSRHGGDGLSKRRRRRVSSVASTMVSANMSVRVARRKPWALSVSGVVSAVILRQDVRREAVPRENPLSHRSRAYLVKNIYEKYC